MKKSGKPEEFKKVSKKLRDDPKGRAEYWRKRHGHLVEKDTPPQPPAPPAPK